MATDLPFIDRHEVEVEADREQVWRTLIENFGSGSRKWFEAYARKIGCEPDAVSGDLEQVGSTRVGFRVSEVIPERQLRLTGNHTFSNYSLLWELTEAGPGRTRLAAITHAEFPGRKGEAYRLLVIQSGAHAMVTQRMLSDLGRRATGAD